MLPKASLMFLIFPAICLPLMCQAQTTLNIQTVGVASPPTVALLNDGRAVSTYDFFTFPDPSTCTPGTHDIPSNCAYPSSYFKGLELLSPGQPAQKLPLNFWGLKFLVNRVGQVVYGSQSNDLSIYDMATNTSSPFLSQSGMPASLTSCLSSGGVNWSSLSDSGMLIGQPVVNVSCTQPQVDSLILFSNKSAKVVPPPSGYRAVSFVGVNAADQIVINALSSTGRHVAFFWNQATGYKALPIPLGRLLQGYTQVFATGLNDAGDVVGFLGKKSAPLQTVVAMLWRGGSAVDIAAKSGFKYSHAVGVVNSGLVVACGSQVAVGSSEQIFIWEKGVSKPWSPALTSDGAQVAPITCDPISFKFNKNSQWLIDASQDTAALHYLVSPQN